MFWGSQPFCPLQWFKLPVPVVLPVVSSLRLYSGSQAGTGMMLVCVLCHRTTLLGGVGLAARLATSLQLTARHCQWALPVPVSAAVGSSEAVLISFSAARSESHRLFGASEGRCDQMLAPGPSSNCPAWFPGVGGAGRCRLLQVGWGLVM